MRGRVKWFDEKKGFGFIAQETGKDIFFHHTSLAMKGFRTIEDGANVEYDVEQSEKGPKAVRVSKV